MSNQIECTTNFSILRSPTLLIQIIKIPMHLNILPVLLIKRTTHLLLSLLNTPTTS